MWQVVDSNCKATSGLGAPEEIYGLWYSFCRDCGVHHALEERDDPIPAPVMKASVIPFRGGTQRPSI